MISQIELFKHQTWTMTVGGSDDKEFARSAGDLGSIPWSARSPTGGNSNLLQYSCLENSMDRGTGQATVHGISKSQT